MENKRKNILNKYLNTNKKKIIAGSVAGLLLVAGVGAYALTRPSDTLV